MWVKWQKRSRGEGTTRVVGYLQFVHLNASSVFLSMRITQMVGEEVIHAPEPEAPARWSPWKQLGNHWIQGSTPGSKVP